MTLNWPINTTFKMAKTCLLPLHAVTKGTATVSKREKTAVNRDVTINTNENRTKNIETAVRNLIARNEGKNLTIQSENTDVVIGGIIVIGRIPNLIEGTSVERRKGDGTPRTSKIQYVTKYFRARRSMLCRPQFLAHLERMLPKRIFRIALRGSPFTEKIFCNHSLLPIKKGRMTGSCS